MKFCSNCGGQVQFRVPADDNRERFVCDACTTIHYINPRIVAGCLVTQGDRVLLCQRAIDPRKGYWTLPAGFMENGESIEEGAARETWEEALAKVSVGELYTVFSLPHISQVYLFYRATLEGGSFGSGPESLACELFSEDQIPWDSLAFPVISSTLKHYFSDRQQDRYPLRSETIVYSRRKR